MTGKPPTARQARFVAEYLRDLNATQAAIRAGYSARTADVAGPRMLGNVRIAEAIAKGKEKLAAKADRDAVAVMRDLARVRRVAMRLALDPQLATRRMIDSKAALKALELEGRHIGMFEDRHVHRVDGLDWRALLGNDSGAGGPGTDRNDGG